MSTTSKYIETAAITAPKYIAGVGNVTITADSLIATIDASEAAITNKDWLVDVTNYEVRQVRRGIHNENKVVLYEPFTNTSTQSLFYIPYNDAKVLYMELTSLGGAGALDNIAGYLAADVTESFGQPNLSGDHTRFVRPVFIDGSTNNVKVNLEYFSNNH
jgi:hypothetical protein